MKKIIVLIITIFTINIANAQWQQTNGPCGGYVMALAIIGNNVFAGTDGGGVYKSMNNGANWDAMNIGLGNDNVTTFVVSDSNLYAGTFNGVFLKTINGTNWISDNNGLTNDVMNNPIFSLAVSGANMYAVSESGLYKSNNWGIDWTLIPEFGNIVYQAVTFSGTNVFTSQYNVGIQFSTDNGVSWDSINKGLPIPATVNPLAANGTNVFVGTDSGVYKLNYNDSTWTPIGLLNQSIRVLTISDTNLFVGTDNGIYKYNINNSIWTAIGLANKHINTIAVNDTNIFVGVGSEGVFLSTNNGITWTAVNNGIITSTINPIATNGTDIYAAVNNWYTNILYKSSDNGNNWSPLNINLLGTSTLSYLAISNSNIFAGSEGEGLFHSLDNGLNWTVDSNGIGYYISSIALKDTNVFVITEGGIFRSNNNGLSWNTFNNGLSLVTTDYESLTILDTNIFVYDINSGKLYYSSINDTSWHFLFTISGNYHYFAVCDGKLIVASSTGLYSISNNGSNWISTTISSFLISMITVSGTNMFGSFNDRIYYSNDNGLNWINVSEGLDTTETFPFIYSLVANGEYLFAGTKYKGVWRRPLSDFVGIKENEINKNIIFVYPNPTKDNLTIETNINTQQRVEILNLIGQTVYTTIINNKKATINTSAFANGVYILKLYTDKETVVRKFVKE